MRNLSPISTRSLLIPFPMYTSLGFASKEVLSVYVLVAGGMQIYFSSIYSFQGHTSKK